MNRVTFIAALVAAAALSTTTQARADDCRAIKNAMLASQRSPGGFRQYLTIGAGSERLTSITQGSAVYLLLGTGHWQKMPRNEIEELDATAATKVDIGNCKVVGEERVKGVVATVYTYMAQGRGSKAISNRIWIGHDGRVLQQGVPGRGLMRFEYNDVKAPS